MRLATWNVNSVVVRLPRLVEWLASSSPDILCLQETKVADDAFPRGEVEALGYEVALNGDGRWNGVAIISRVGSWPTLSETSTVSPASPGSRLAR